MAFKKAGCPVLGMEKTRRKPGLDSRGESRADGGGTREGTSVFLTGSLPGRRTPGDKRERPGAGRAGKGVPGRRNGLGLRGGFDSRFSLPGELKEFAGRGQRTYFV